MKKDRKHLSQVYKTFCKSEKVSYPTTIIFMVISIKIEKACQIF